MKSVPMVREARIEKNEKKLLAEEAYEYVSKKLYAFSQTLL
jgi:hypothetical protein